MKWERIRAGIFGPVRRLAKVSPYLFSVRKDPQLRSVARTYTHWMPLNIYSEPLRWIWQFASNHFRYQIPLQRPYDIYVSRLTAQPFPLPSHTAAHLENHWREIHREFLQVSDRLGPPPNYDHVASGRWNTFDMIAGGRVNEALAAQCPETMALVRALPLVDMVTFSILTPGTHLKPHYGPTNIKHRHQLCLENAQGARIRVGDQWRTWEEGKCVVIDDSFNHEVIHEGDRRRVVLLVDCWHPELSKAERHFIETLYRAWGSMAN